MPAAWSHIGRLAGRSLPLLVAALLLGCGGTGIAPAPKHAAVQRALPGSPDAWRREVERLMRRGQDQAALRAIGSARAHGASGPEIDVFESVALWQLGLHAKGAAADARLTKLVAAGLRARPEATVDSELWRVFEQLVAFHVKRRGAPAHAWRMLEPLLDRGCSPKRLCALTRRVLVAWPQVPAELLARVAKAAPASPTPGPTARVRRDFTVGLIRELIVARRWSEVEILIESALVAHRQDAQIWALTFFAARRRRGPSYRDNALRVLERAKLSPATLTALVRQPEVAGDRLLVADLWHLITARPEATERHWSALAAALAHNELRGDASRPREALIALADKQAQHFVTPRARQELVATLLSVGLHAEATPWLGRLLALGRQPETLVLQAEWLRQTGRLDEARSVANQAWQLATDRPTVALRLARLWAATLPQDAAAWEQRATAASHSRSLGALQAQVARQLSRSHLATAGEQQVLSYARALVLASRAARLSAAGRRDLRARIDALSEALLGRRHNSTWRPALAAAFGILAGGPLATAALLERLALLSFERPDADAGLAAYARARAMAQAEATTLDDEAMVRAVLRSGDSRALARWLTLSGLRRTENLQTSWDIASRLMSGADRVLGRRWVERTLARFAGSDVLGARLEAPMPGRRPPPLAGRTPALPTPQLESMARDGAADLLLEYIRDTRAAPGEAGSIAEEVKYAHAEATALVALGRPAEAAEVLRQTWRLEGLSPLYRRNLLALAHNTNLCPLVLEMAHDMVIERDLVSVNIGLKDGLACARNLGDAPAALRLAQRLEKSQVDRRSHIMLAEQLAKNGFQKLALPLFERNYSNAKTLLPYRALEPWAWTLLSMGRVEPALSVLRVARGKGRRSAADAMKAAELLGEFGHLIRAEAFIRYAVGQQPGNLDMRKKLIVNMLRTGEMQDLRAQLLAFLRLGPSSEALEQLAEEAARQRRLPQLHDIAAEVTDSDRDLERFRMGLAARLGLRKAVATSARQLRSGGHGARAAERLLEVGATEQAREAVEDLLASTAPVASSAGRVGRVDVLVAALAARRDPSSEAEAAAIARLFVGRALDASQAAAQAASVMARHGLTRLAVALRAVALERAPTDALLLCRQGVDQWTLGEHGLALASWRPAMAALLIDGRSGNLAQRASADDEQAALGCLVAGLSRAGERSRLLVWLQRWLEMAPERTDLWHRLLQLQLDGNQVSAALQTLRRSARQLKQWPEQPVATMVQDLLDRGAGAQLADWLLEHPEELRAEAWWLATATGILHDHAPAGRRNSAQGRRLRASLQTLVRNDPEARLRTALVWSARGRPEHALKALGDSPFALDPRLTKPNLKLRTLAARAAAATLISLARDGARAAVTAEREGGAAAPLNLGATGRESAVVEQVSAWLRGAGGAPELERLAGALAVQGHEGLARRVLGLVVRHGSVRPGPDATRERLRVLLAGADDEAVAAAARAFIVEPGPIARPDINSRVASLLAASRIGRRSIDVIAAVAKSGRTSLARRLSATPEPGAFRLGPPVTPVHGGPLDLRDDADLAELAARYDPMVLRRAVDDGALPPRDTALAVADVAIAAGRAPLALAWTAAVASADDEPWRAWLRTLRSAVNHGERRLAVDLLRRAAKAGAPAGVLACPRLWLEGTGTLAACRRDRPLSALALSAPDDWTDLALATVRTDDAAGVAALTDDLVGAPAAVLAAWVGALARHRDLIPAADRSRLAAHLGILVARLPEGLERQRLLDLALDDLAALGAPQPGLLEMERRRRHTGEIGSNRNNLAYAQLLAGKSPTDALRLAAPDLGRPRGQPTHALLDTMAACMWRAGQHDAAISTLYRSLGAGAFYIDGGLSQVRLAEFLLARGQKSKALDLARIGLASATAYREESLDAEGWQLVLDTSDAISRARSVIRTVLRAAP